MAVRFHVRQKFNVEVVGGCSNLEVVMYGKFFAHAFTGSMMGAGLNVFAVWAYVIANTCGSQVEVNVKLLSLLLGASEEDVEDAIKYLCSPDEKSRNPAKEGRRLVHVAGFTYEVVNHETYRRIRCEDDRREYNRQKKAESRAKSKSNGESLTVIDSQRQSMVSANTEAEAEAEEKTKPRKPAVRQTSLSESQVKQFEEFWQAFPKKTAKGHARKAWTVALRKTELSVILLAVKAFAASVAGKDPEFIAHPATWLNGERWMDVECASPTQGPQATANTDWIEALKRTRQYPTDWESRKAAIGAELFEAVKRTGTADVAAVTSFNENMIRQIFLSHLEDIRNAK